MEKSKEQVMLEFLDFLNDNLGNDKLVLKGGSAFRFCYGLDRMSEDLDFDSEKKLLNILVPKFCEKYGYEYTKKKSKLFTERYTVSFDNNQKPLKIETSLRNPKILDESLVRENDILTYEFNQLCLLKLAAYLDRDKIRDAYDVTFIASNKLDELNENVKFFLKTALSSKGLDYIDNLIESEQNYDTNIDKDKLIENTLNSFDNLGLLSSVEERECILEQKDRTLKDDKDIEKEPGSDFF